VSWVSRPYVTLIRMSSGPEQRSELSRGRSHLEREPRRGSGCSRHKPRRAASLLREPDRKPTGHRNAFRCDHGWPVVINSATAGD
jgi:hypothetical protein